MDFFRSVGRLKTLPRQGWVDRGIPSPESVADHTYRSAMMAWALGELAGLDTARLVKLALLHDVPEAEVGDATPYDGILARGTALAEVLPRWRQLLSPEELSAWRREKELRESRALANLSSSLPPSVAAELVDLWTDYLERRTPEARFAAQVDKLEALLQAIEYREAGYEADVESFLASAREAVEHPVLVAFLAELGALVSSSREGMMLKTKYFLESPSSRTPEEIEAWLASLPTADQLNWDSIIVTSAEGPTDVSERHHEYLADFYGKDNPR